jgi:hypothetical protein
MYTFAEVIGASPADIEAALLVYLGGLYAAITSITSTAWGCDLVDVNLLTGHLSSPITSFVFSINGTSGGDELPQDDAYIVIGKTARKKTLGRKFLPGIPESYQNAGTINSGALAALVTYGGLYITPTTVGSVTLDPGVYNRKTSIFNTFVSFRADPYTANQRRRSNVRH